VRPSNTAAISCYNSTGFNEIGCRKDYYPASEGREDALLFARHISQPADVHNS
jgi:ribosomal-protein-alanine N-acetyltransferase